MSIQVILAVLHDEVGKLLLVRRKESLLWTLPGGILRAPVRSRAEFLTVCCRRQIGIAPEFVAPLREFVFAGQTVTVGCDEVAAERARACGRVEMSRWFHANELPVEFAPLARMAANLFPMRRSLTGLRDLVAVSA